MKEEDDEFEIPLVPSKLKPNPPPLISANYSTSGPAEVDSNGIVASEPALPPSLPKSGVSSDRKLAEPCPVCATSLDLSNEVSATAHINRCLDGQGSTDPQEETRILEQQKTADAWRYIFKTSSTASARSTQSTQKSQHDQPMAKATLRRSHSAVRKSNPKYGVGAKSAALNQTVPIASTTPVGRGWFHAMKTLISIHRSATSADELELMESNTAESILNRKRLHEGELDDPQWTNDRDQIDPKRPRVDFPTDEGPDFGPHLMKRNESQCSESKCNTDNVGSFQLDEIDSVQFSDKEGTNEQVDLLNGEEISSGFEGIAEYATDLASSSKDFRTVQSLGLSDSSFLRSDVRLSQEESEEPQQDVKGKEKVKSGKVNRARGLGTSRSGNTTELSGSRWNRQRQCPWYKRMPETSFTVDAFSYGSIPGCTAYFLSHFHSDHYGGLTSKFVHGPIFCSKVTANLVKKQLGVDPQYLFPLPLNETVTVQGVQVTLIDANHCPGAVLFLFEIFSPDRSTMRYLHTGDFRVHPILHLKNPLLPNPTSADGTLNPPLDIIFLDTTYCNPSHAFPPQDQVIETITELAFEVCCNGRSPAEVVGGAKKRKGQSMFGGGWTKAVAFMRSFTRLPPATATSDLRNGALQVPGLTGRTAHAKNPRTLVVVGTYLIGKERVFKSIARALRSKVYVDAAKARILACLEDEELNQMLTRDPLSAGVHVMSIGHLNIEHLKGKLDSVSSRYDHILAVRPTGWTFRGGSKGGDTEFSLLSLSINQLSSSISVVGVPYSEHSSFAELAMFVGSIAAKKVIPTVNVNRSEDMQKLFEGWRAGGAV